VHTMMQSVDDIELREYRLRAQLSVRAVHAISSIELFGLT
jgi:hypothetical protein